MGAKIALLDPVSLCRELPDKEILAYRETFGEDSREWIIAKRELARRKFPTWKRVIYDQLKCAYWLGWEAPEPVSPKPGSAPQ